MLPAISFDDQTVLGAREVHDKALDWMLAAKFVTGQASAAQRKP